MLRQLSLALLLSLGLSARGEEPAAQLLLPSRKLEPKSTFEIRFAAEMVPADQVGKAAAVSPLVLQPPLEGRFVWLSTRSGSFAPANPLPLATKYQITLAPGLKDASGKAVSAKLRETAETPPMRVKGIYDLGSTDLKNASSVPRFLVLFNANVDAGAAAKFFRFEDAARKRIAARVEQAGDPAKRDRSFPAYKSDDGNLSAWSAQPEPAEKVAPPDFESEDGRRRNGNEKGSAIAGQHSLRRAGKAASAGQRLAACDRSRDSG